MSNEFQSPSLETVRGFVVLGDGSFDRVIRWLVSADVCAGNAWMGLARKSSDCHQVTSAMNIPLGGPDMSNDSYFNRLNGPRLQQRQVDELIGLAKGIVADDQLVNSELDYLVRWLVANREITSDPLVAALYRQIRSMLSDGVFTEEERGELLGILKDFGSHPMEMGEPMLSTEIPFASPLPRLGFESWRYCFTGTFSYGTRDACEAAVSQRGAAAGSLTKNTDVLVVGHYATESWLHSAYELKIIKAITMQGARHRHRA